MVTNREKNNKYRMCTIIAKKFPKIGWVGVKNRDRPVDTKTQLVRLQTNGIECVTLMDEQTGWTEGMNSHGVSIISSSLTPMTTGHPTVSEHQSKNGQRLKAALSQPNVAAAVSVLHDLKVTGCVMVFDQNSLWLIEGMKNYSDQQVIRKITTDYVARTNHGIWIPSAGYSSNSDNNLMTMFRLSSLARLDIANYILATAKTPEELMPLLAKTWVDNPQLTTLRSSTADIDDQTTEQLMIEPLKKLVLIRNLHNVLDFRNKAINPLGSKILVGVVKA